MVDVRVSLGCCGGVDMGVWEGYVLGFAWSERAVGLFWGYVLGVGMTGTHI